MEGTRALSLAKFGPIAAASVSRWLDSSNRCTRGRLLGAAGWTAPVTRGNSTPDGVMEDLESPKEQLWCERRTVLEMPVLLDRVDDKMVS